MPAPQFIDCSSKRDTIFFFGWARYAKMKNATAKKNFMGHPLHADNVRVSLFVVEKYNLNWCHRVLYTWLFQFLPH